MVNVNLFVIISLLCGTTYSLLIESGLDEGQKDTLLSLHNIFRIDVANGLAAGITASNMNALIWDTTLEKYAQNHANTCPTKKNPEEKYPELILSANYEMMKPSLTQIDLNSMFNYWKNMSAFQNTTDAVDTPTTLINFNYLAWANAESIGCGLSICQNTNYTINLICNYKAQTNLLLFDPIWLRGAPGSACPPGRISNGVLCTGVTILRPTGIYKGATLSIPPPKGTYGPMSGSILATTNTVITPQTGRILYQSGMTGDLRQRLINLHNEKRQLVASGQASPQPEASNMQLMVYDSRYESIPIDWAKSCPDTPNNNRGNYGENLYWYYGQFQPSLISFPIEQVVEVWYNEIQNMEPTLVGSFGQANSKVVYPKMVGHYTQVVWANSNVLFCGGSVCKQTSQIPWILTIVCNYAEQGNNYSQAVYLSGTKCSQCPSGTVCVAPYDALCSPQ